MVFYIQYKLLVFITIYYYLYSKPLSDDTKKIKIKTIVKNVYSI